MIKKEVVEAIAKLSPEECILRYVDAKNVGISALSVLIAFRDKRLTEEARDELINVCIEMYDNIAAPQDQYDALLLKGKKLFDMHLPETGEDLTAEQRKKMN